MADLTPLSVSRPLDKKTKKIHSDQDSYEAKIKKEGFKHDNSLGSGDKPHEGEKPSNYQAVSSSLFAAFDPPSLEPRTTSAEATLSTGNPLALHPEHKPRPQAHASQTLNLDTSTSITTGPSSSALTSARLPKEQMANIADKDGYRPTARHSHPSDQEEDSNDDHATESDLESHADDDDFNYAADPEEDEGYDSLQSPFRNVKIRKHQRDEVVDAENDDEARRSAGTAHSNHGSKLKTSRQPLMERERIHRGKKSRTAEKLSVADGRLDAYGDRLS